LNVEEIIFITGYLGNQIKEYVDTNYKFKAVYVEQTEMLGQAHAIYLAHEYVKTGDDVLVIFADTIFKTNLGRLNKLSSDGVLYVREVPDPARFGVTVLNGDGIITKLVEKPKTPVSNLAVIGVYYFKDGPALMEATNTIIKRGQTLGGEFFLADAIQVMIDQGSRFEAFPVEVWEDCGKVDALLQTNSYLLAQMAKEGTEYKFEGSVIVPPVYIAPDAKIINSIVGPNVSVAPGATITDSIVQNSIVNEKANIERSTLSDSVIGSNANVVGAFRRLNVGDNSEVDFNAS
jgi:glucose-1-phosphate thymidylyltransferase